MNPMIASRGVSTVKILLLLGAIVVGAVLYSYRAELPTVLSASPSGVLLEELTPFRMEFRSGERPEIVVSVLNTGPVDTTIAAVQVGGSHPFATWSFIAEPSLEIARLSTATVKIPYRWIEGEPYAVKIITSTGVSFIAETEAAVPAYAAAGSSLTTPIVLGIFVGVVPVYLGIAPLPLLRKLKQNWIDFLAALAAGVLVFLFVDTVEEGFEIAGRLSLSLGPTLVIAGFLIGVLGLVAFGRLTLGREESKPEGASSRRAAFYLAYMIAAAIGLHNFGEGLAIGAAQTAGRLGLALLLILGFALHNTTEGLAIVSPIVREKVSLRQPALMGFIAGAPTIGGTLLSFTFYSDAINALFFAIAAGAILYVVAEIIMEIAAKPGASNSPSVYGGLLTGIFIMYVTAVALTVLVGEV